MRSNENGSNDIQYSWRRFQHCPAEDIRDAAYYPIEDGWFMVRILDFPGVISQGRDIEHARKMIKDALCLMAEHKLEQGESLPRPNPKARDQKAVLVESIEFIVSGH